MSRHWAAQGELKQALSWLRGVGGRGGGLGPLWRTYEVCTWDGGAEACRGARGYQPGTHNAQPGQACAGVCYEQGAPALQQR